MERLLRNRWVVMASLGLAPACGGKAAQNASSTEDPPASGGTAPTAGAGGAPAAGAATAGAAAIGASSPGGTNNAGGGADSVDAGAAGAPSEPELPRPYRALEVVAGALHSCALLEDHRVKCWGLNHIGELGLEDVEPRGVDPSTMGDALPFVNLGTGRTAKQLAAGRYGTCAVLDDDSVKCWGTGSFHYGGTVVGGYPGQMGDNLPPEQLPPGRKVKAVSVGYNSSCAILDDESLICSGRRVALPDRCHPVRLYGNLAALVLCQDASLWGVDSPYEPPKLLASNVTHVASADYYECYRQQDGEFYCGDSGYVPSPLPEPRDIAIAESQKACAVNAAGAVDCWQRYEDSVPWAPGAGRHIPVPLEEPALTVSGGRGHHCALMESGAIVCWNWGDTDNDAVGAPTLNEPKLPPVNLGTYYPR